jgi:LCP family protein required for cell wall assembly
MRTTLKRGFGRAAAVNGNGRTVLPPGVLEPMRRYRQPVPPSRTTRGLVFRILGWIVVALAVVVSGLAGGVYLYGHETLSALAPHSAGVKKAQGDLAKLPAATEPATALIVGYDKRAGDGGFTAADSRSDTLMLMRADPQLNTLSLLSFPRDLQVPIYCDATTAIATDRINSAWTRCSPNGAKGALDTVQKLTGLSINYLITIDFHGFKLLVNKLKGVYMGVDHRYINTQGGTCSSCFATIDIRPGYQKLDGQKALDFVRFRHTDSDIYRLARQQLFLEALKDRLATSLSIFSIPGVIGAVKHNVEIARGGEGGAPGISEIQAYAGLAYHLQGGHMFRVQIPNLQDCGFANAQVCASQSDIASAVSSFQHPDVSLPDRANAAALGRKAKPPKKAALQRSAVSTLILNGTTVPGLARDTSYKLAVAGFHTVQLPGQLLPNAPSSSYYSNVVYYDSVQPNAKQAAAQLKVAFGAHTQVTPLTPEIAAYAQQAGNPLTVAVVGTAFDGNIVDPEANVAEAPTHAEPLVSPDPDPSTTRSALQEVRSKLSFAPMVPNVLASGSRFTSLEPVRAFKPVAGKSELALTYVTGAGNVYWQVIQTDWTTAPVLRKPTGRVTLKDGRRYDLYTNGAHMHMVVLRHAGATYWVVNTLRDELSNETMLAIAKGLRPLGK